MSEHDRGAYTPQTDAPLAFDARAPRGGRRPLPLALIGGGVLLLVLVAALGMYYSSGVGPSPGAPPTVGQPVDTVKSPPNAVEAAADNAAEPGVFAQAPAPAAPAFAPAPEQPQPRPAAQLSVQTVEPNQVKPAAPAAVPPAPAMAAAKPPAAPAAPPASKPIVVATAPVKPVPTAPPAAKPATAPAPVAAAKPAAPVAKPAAPVATAAAGGAWVQIGAYSSAALADKGYGQASSEFPGFMVGRTKHVERVDRDGKTLFRTSVMGFPTKATAQSFCDAWKAKGRPCFVRG